MAASDSDFGDVIKLLTPSDLRELYYELSISSRNIQTWEADAGERSSMYLKARNVLENWRKRVASKASRQAILVALERCNNVAAKEKLQNLWDLLGTSVCKKITSEQIKSDAIPLQTHQHIDDNKNTSYFYQSGGKLFYPFQVIEAQEEIRVVSLSPSEAEKRLIQNCRRHGLTFHGYTPADGNCFFHAISDQLSLLGLPHQSAADLRSNVVVYLLNHEQLEGPDGTIELSATQPDWEAYLQSMSKDGEWADAIILVAMAHMLKRDILVVTSSPKGSGDHAYQWIVGDVNFAGTPIRIGHVWELHYKSLDKIQHKPEKTIQTYVHKWRKTLTEIYTNRRGKIRFGCHRTSVAETDDIFVDLQLLPEGDITKTKHLESYEGLFQIKDRNQQQCLHILVRGHAGTGKSTLVSRLAYKWATLGKDDTYRYLDMFQLIITLDARRCIPGENLQEAVRKQLLTSESTECIANELGVLGRNCIYLVDGFDEMSQQSWENETHILDSPLLNDSYVIITTRAHVVDRFCERYAIIIKCVHVNLSGFSHWHVGEYVDKFFKLHGNTSLSESLSDKIKSVPLLQSLSTFPILLLMLCHLWLDQERDHDLPESLTNLYNEAIQYLNKHWVERNKKDTSKIMSELGKAAIGSLFKGKLTFDSNTLSNECVEDACNIGLIYKEPMERHRTGITFIHKTFHEFCAAFYWSHLASNDIETFNTYLVQISSKNILDMEYLLRFCCGHDVIAASAILNHIFYDVYSGQQKVDQNLPLILLSEASSRYHSETGYELHEQFPTVTVNPSVTESSIVAAIASLSLHSAIRTKHPVLHQIMDEHVHIEVQKEKHVESDVRMKDHEQIDVKKEGNGQTDFKRKINPVGDKMTLENTQTIEMDSSGGKIKYSKTVSLQVPRDALYSSVLISVSEVMCDDYPPLSESQFVAAKVLCCQPHGQTFQKPVTISMKHSFINLNTNYIEIWCKADDASSNTTKWEKIYDGMQPPDGITAFVDQENLHFRIKHFSIFTVITKQISTIYNYFTPEPVMLELIILAYMRPANVSAAPTVFLTIHAVRMENEESIDKIEDEEAKLGSFRCARKNSFLLQPNGNNLKVCVKNTEPKDSWNAVGEELKAEPRVEITFADLQKGRLISYHCEIKFKKKDKLSEEIAVFEGDFTLEQDNNSDTKTVQFDDCLAKKLSNTYDDTNKWRQAAGQPDSMPDNTLDVNEEQPSTSGSCQHVETRKRPIERACEVVVFKPQKRTRFSTMAASESDFDDVIKHLTPPDLKHFYHALGLLSKDIQTWEADAGDKSSVHLQARRVLENWKKRVASEASRQAILDALEACNNKDAKEKLQDKWNPRGEDTLKTKKTR